MQTAIPQNWIEERNKEITHAKAGSIGHIFNLAHGLIYGGGSQPEARQVLQIKKLSGADYYAVRAEIENFLVGSGQESTGFIGQILAANDTEEFRAVINSYGGSISVPEDMEVTVDNVVKYAKSWLARNAWMDLQLVLKPLRSPAAGMHAAPN